MKFIARNLNIIGILLLMTFAAAAAGLYWNVPQRFQKSPQTRPQPSDRLEAKTVPVGVDQQMGVPAPESAPASCPMHQQGAASTAGEAGCAHSQGGGCCNKSAAEPAAVVPAQGCTRHTLSPDNSQ
jgi:hypothetical protein